MAKELDPLDFARKAEDLGFQGLDYVNTFFKDKAGDRAYLAEMKKRSDGAGLVNDLILVDGEGAIGDPGCRGAHQGARQPQALGGSRQGARMPRHPHQCRSAAARRTSSAQRVIEGARALTEFADTQGLEILIENHGGQSSDAAWLDSVVRGVRIRAADRSPTSATGTWAAASGTTATRASPSWCRPPRASASRRTASTPTATTPRPTSAKMMKIVVDGGYRGRFLEIEYEGEELSETEGTRAAKLLLDRTLAAL